MKRDMELVRELLFYLEGKPSGKFQQHQDIKIDKFTSLQIGHHLIWMYQDGLINGEISRSSTTPDRIINVYPFDLTWKGHELLDDVRDGIVWKETKNVSKSINGVSLEIIRDLAKAVIRKKLNEMTGGDYTL